MKRKMVAVLIVTFNAEDWIHGCLSSVLKSSSKPDVYIVDNNSTDKTIQIIEGSFKEVNIIKSCTNLGFGRANNLGFTEILKSEYNYVLLLNQDARIKFDTIDRLILMSKNNPEYGIISPIQLYNEKNLDCLFEKFLKNTEGIISEITLKKSKLIETDFVNAAIWLITTPCLRKIGGFDPLFMHYGEDREYCNRVQYFGFKVGVAFGIIGYHYRNQGLKKYNTLQLLIGRYYQSYLVELKRLDKSFHKLLFNLTRRTMVESFDNIIYFKRKSFVAGIIAYIKIISRLGRIYTHRKENLFYDLSFLKY